MYELWNLKYTRVWKFNELENSANVNENFILLLKYIVIFNLEDKKKKNTNVLQMKVEELYRKNLPPDT